MENSARNPIDNLKPNFSSTNQPSPELKKKGWERRKMAQEMMDLYDKFMHMTYRELQDFKDDIENHPELHTVIEVDMFNYAKKPKFIIDRIDRHVSKAPQNIEITDKPDDSDPKQVLTPEQRKELSDGYTELFKKILK
jgi:Spy/CpxP family protein refolding chaperone